MKKKLNRTVKIENLQEVFRADEVETWASNNVNTEVKKGEFVTIMGPSGCGKSTLLNILGLLDILISGSCYLEGVDVSQYTEAKQVNARKGVIGSVLQSLNLIEELNVYENIELPLLYMGVPVNQRKQRIEEAITRMGAGHRPKYYPRQFSGGQQQRVAIARVVIDHPELILADESTDNLDLKNGKEVTELLIKLNKAGTTIITVTHFSHDAGYVDRIINLFGGKIANGELQTTYDQLDNTKDST